MKMILTAALILVAAPAFAQDYVGRTAAEMRAALRDPDSVKDAMRTPPFQCRKSVCVCVRANAKNGFGGYAGATDYTVRFFPEGDVQIMEDTSLGCERYGWKPFPEIERR